MVGMSEGPRAREGAGMGEHMRNGNTTPTDNRGDTGEDANAEYALALDEREDALDPEPPPAAP